MSPIDQDQTAGAALRERFETGEIYIPFDELTWLDFCGADRGKVLSNLTTNHVASLSPGEGCETFITDVRGKTFGHGLVFALEDRLRLITVAGQADRLSQHVNRYVIREEVTVEDRSPDFHTVFLPGVEDTCFTRRHGLSAAPVPRLKTQTIEFGDTQVRVYQVPWTRDGDWLLAVRSEKAEALDAAMVECDILPGHCSLMHCGRISNMYPWFGIDCDESNLPQEMGRDERTIDFKKGCYLGQETIARLDAMGQVQKKLTLWRFDGDAAPKAGTELRSDGKVVAKVTSSTYCFAYGAPLALAMTRRSHFAPGATADSEIGSAKVIDPAVDTE